ncbi:hypothetical protein GCM10027290_17590 [Micromonospora sonneratiae]|uniref:Uncharacterized protein n=1 Tax=Micromonospora sonneratiae TaxID=1184706 RepID=A0ABW3YBA0_9ACTN
MLVKSARTDNGGQVTIESERGYTGSVYKVYLNGAYQGEYSSIQDALAKFRELGGKS